MRTCGLRASAAVSSWWKVHASDAYMSGLLRSLLGHHLRVGGWAMLLSATLGARARSAFTASAGVATVMPALSEAISAPYPAVTLLGAQPTAVAAGAVQDRWVHVELVPHAFRPERVLDEIASALHQGGRVLAVLNTVGRANAFLRSAEQRGDLPSGSLFSIAGVACPHHGRFAPQDRLVLDREVSSRLGPGSGPKQIGRAHV